MFIEYDYNCYYCTRDYTLTKLLQSITPIEEQY
jgi:hypothetical protein